jgi:chromate transport protein ChrA
MTQTTDTPETDAPACPADCTACQQFSSHTPGAISGWRLGLAALAVFVFPLACALVAAAVCPPAYETPVAVAALLVGAAAVSLVVRWVRQKPRRVHGDHNA